MIEHSIEPKRRLLSILHRGFVEARLLASAEKHQQLFDLADALETIPGCIDHWQDEHFDSIRFNLRTYREKYGSQAFDYLAYLEDYPPPERF